MACIHEIMKILNACTVNNFYQDYYKHMDPKLTKDFFVHALQSYLFEGGKMCQHLKGMSYLWYM